MATKTTHKKKAEAFNKKFKVGAKIQYKDSKGQIQKGTLKHEAIAQETQASIYLHEASGKVSLDNVISK